MYQSLSFVTNTVLWVKGEGNYTRLVTAGEQFLIRAYLSEMLLKLPVDIFLRVHKSYGINLKAVEEIRPTCVLIEDAEVPVYQAYRPEMTRCFERH